MVQMDDIMDGAELSEDPTRSHGLVPRACDACRARKIRCNRGTPCAHCVHAKIECTHSEAAKPREKRTRILLSHQYEKKIDLIYRRLDGVLRLLEELKTSLPSESSSRTATGTPVPRLPLSIGVASSSSPASHGSHASHADSTGTVVEGDSSLTAHSVFATDLLQNVVSKESRPEMLERVDALHHIVEAMKKQPAVHEMSYPNAKPTRPVSLQECNLPPIDKTFQVLKFVKSRKLYALAWVYELFNMDRFETTCLAVYMADKYNAAKFITVNVGLHFLFTAYAQEVAEKQHEYLGLSRICAANVETALSNLPLHLPASSDAIVALVLGAFYVVDLSKPSLAWILSSKASELCQTLGYHRIETYKDESPDDAEFKQFLFWAVYCVDKGLSLRLGRSSTIQDYDITVPYVASGDPSRTPVNDFFRLWIIGSKIHGRIYEMLYCPEAIAQPGSVRKSRAELLARQQEEFDALTRDTIAKLDKVNREMAGNDVSDFFIISDEVVRLSTLTLIHRAVPNPPGSPTTFTAECIRAARETLARHQDCMEVVERSKIGLFSTYMSWTILFTPFIPFIVLFCHVIETRDREDLARLQGFVATLQQSDNTVVEAVDKLRRLFQVLYIVASQYVDSQTSNGNSENQAQPNLGVDTYLAALGFPWGQGSDEQHSSDFLSSASGGGMGNAAGQEAQRGVNPMIWMGNGEQLEDWFLSNQQMMALLDDEFSAQFNGQMGG
ncbi:hypothetical protein VTI74DRAFT_5870 [Chaetomium olivicolor]